MTDDEILRDLCISSSSYVQASGDNPTVFSLQDTIDLIKKKYGENWLDFPHCIMTVLWSARIFEEGHVQEVINESCPSIMHLWKELSITGKINGQELPEGMPLLAIAVCAPGYPKIENSE